MSTDALASLMRRITVRRQVAFFASRFRWSILVVSALFLLLLLAARLLALLPNWFTPVSLWTVPLAALLCAALFLRRASAREVARLIDQRSGSKELFLTAAMIEQAHGEFQPIVIAQAEARASQIAPKDVVPFGWRRGVRDVALALALLLAGTLWLPQFDPLGRNQQRMKTAQQQQRLAETKKLTALRAEQLAETRGTQSEQVQRALAELEKTFKEAKPQLREANLKRLADQQKELGEMWRKVANELPRDAFDKAAQHLGQVDANKVRQMRDELKKGDLSAVKKELSELRAEMQKLASAPDSAEKRAQQERVAQRLGSLAQTLAQQFNSPQLNAALARALQQLDMAKLQQLGKNGMEAAQDSLKLSEAELEKLVEMLKNVASLEEALKNLQMARQLAGLCQLDGEACKNCNGMGDYAALYAKLLGLQKEIGPGMGPNPGIGAGGKAPEDDSLLSSFKTEKTNTALSGGKMLLQWKTKEVGETGARVDDYRDILRQVKQGVSEAIISEQVPAGYHATIQKYFDSLPEK
jgi:hypothetical protein